MVTIPPVVLDLRIPGCLKSALKHGFGNENALAEACEDEKSSK